MLNSLQRLRALLCGSLEEELAKFSPRGYPEPIARLAVLRPCAAISLELVSPGIERLPIRVAIEVERVAV